MTEVVTVTTITGAVYSCRLAYDSSLHSSAMNADSPLSNIDEVILDSEDDELQPGRQGKFYRLNSIDFLNLAPH